VLNPGIRILLITKVAHPNLARGELKTRLDFIWRYASKIVLIGTDIDAKPKMYEITSEIKADLSNFFNFSGESKLKTSC